MPSSSPLGVNVFTVPEKAVVGERPRLRAALGVGPDHFDADIR